MTLPEVNVVRWLVGVLLVVMLAAMFAEAGVPEWSVVTLLVLGIAFVASLSFKRGKK